ncbi:hypothetical protein LUQ84_002605 [Hamiltosporidium tvaerminnensis]|nr:hypothetical protein LUQ84_002605 [Hamiltosporidium tvaerminnensis]
MKPIIFLFYILVTYTVTNKRNKQIKMLQKKSKPKTIKSIPDFVIYNDKNSLVYKILLNKPHIEGISNYLSTIFNRYLNQESFETKIKEIVSDFKKIPHNEKNYEELYDTVSSYLENQLDDHKEMFLTKYKTDEIRKQFFEYMFRTSKNEICIPDSYFLAPAIKYSVSKLGVCTSFKTSEEVFLKNIEKTGTLENDIIINVLIRRFENFILYIQTFLPIIKIFVTFL